MFGYGFLAVVLVLYLAALGLDPLAIGIVLTLTLIGDTLISLWLTTNADRLGRRRVLVAGSLLMVVAGHRLRVHELGPAADPRRRRSASSRRPATRSGRSSRSSRRRSRQTVPDQRRTADVRLVQPRRLRRHRDGRARRRAAQPGAARRRRWRRVDAYRAIVIGYAVIGLAMAVGFWRLGPAIEAPPRERRHRRHPAPARARSLEGRSSSSCRSCSRSTPSAAASSRRA